MFEVGMTTAYDLEEFQSLGYVNAVVLVVGGIVAVPLWMLWKVHPWYKVGAAFVLFGLSWWLLASQLEAGQMLSTVQTLLLVMALHSMAELLFAPMVYSLICRYGYLPMVGTFLGLYGYSIAISNWIGGGIYGQGVNLHEYVLACMAIGMLVIVIRMVWSKTQPHLATMRDPK